MSGHTPGPWLFGQNSTYETALVGPNGESVAEAAWTGGSGCELRVRNDADANLIAAAPELLEECIKLLELYSKENQDAARAVVAKAKGGAS